MHIYIYVCICKYFPSLWLDKVLALPPALARKLKENVEVKIDKQMHSSIRTYTHAVALTHSHTHTHTYIYIYIYIYI